MAVRFNILMAMAMLCCVAGAHERELAVEPEPAAVYQTTTEASPCAIGPVPTPAPVSPCGTVAPVPIVTTVTTTPASPCGTVAPAVYTTVTTTPGTTVTTTPAPSSAPAPASPCGTVAPVPAGTYTTTPGATYTTTPGATYTTTPAQVTVAPAAKFAMDRSAIEKKGQSLIQRMTDTPITFGLFSLLLASAVVGMIVRATRSYRRSTRLTFSGRTINYDGVPASDIESNQAFAE